MYKLYRVRQCEGKTEEARQRRIGEDQQEMRNKPWRWHH